MSNADSVFKSVVDECQEDYVGLWSVIREVRGTLVERAFVVEATLSLIKRLLLEGDLVAGTFDMDIDNDFHQWNMPVEDIINKIKRDWAELGHDPTLGDVVWFTRRDRN